MHENLKNSLGLACIAATLAGCAADTGRYPSLAMRAFESGPVPVAPGPAQPIRPLTPQTRIDELRGAATSSHAAFVAQEGTAARLVRAAAGQSIESSARAAALVALADLDARRGATASTLATVDRLEAEAATMLSPDPTLAAVQADIAALVERQDQTIARLWAAMGAAGGS
ncbi:hypothetical protein [Erythrobacter sp. R86502]|uniref:hypothetical protein n=1 Tax=Erythrobacter sp. R86502 TaxID=3093846 RepID=UPI0036D263DA